MKSLFKNYILLIAVAIFISGCTTPSNTYIFAESYNKIYKKNKIPKKNIFLRIDSGTHSGRIEKIIVTKDKKEIITVAKDNIIKVWDIKTGEEKRKILGEYSDGVQIENIVLSPDGKYLFSAGKFINKKNDKLNTIGDIRMYDYKSGKLIKLIKGQNYVVNLLLVSSDNKYLIVKSGHKIDILDIEKEFKIVKTIQPNNNYTIGMMTTAKVNNKNIIYYTGGGKVIQTFIEDDTKKVKLNRVGNIFATSKNLFVIRDSVILEIYDHNFNLIKREKSKKKLDRFTASENEKYLLIGGFGTNNLSTARDGFADGKIYDLSNNYKKIYTFKRHKMSLTGMAFIDNNTVVTSGGSSNDMYIWKIKTGEIINHIKGIGTIWYEPKYNKNIDYEITFSNFSSHEKKYFNFKTKKNGKVKNLENYIIASKKGSYNLRKRGFWIDRGSLYRDKLIYEIDGKRFVMFRDFSNGYAHRAMNFTENYFIDSGYGNFVDVFDHRGNHLAALVGNTGNTTASTIKKNLLYMTSFDQKIRVWDLNKIKYKGFPQVLNSNVSLFYSPNGEWIMWTPEGYFDSSENGYKYVGFHINKGYKKEAQWIKIEKLYDHFYRPDLVQLSLESKDISQFTNGMTYEEALKNPPPEIKIKENNLKTKKKNITINFDVKQIDGGGVGLIRVYQEGKLVKTIGKGKIKRASVNAVEKLNEDKLNKESKLKQKQYLASLEGSITKSINGILDTSELVETIQTTTTNNKDGSYSITLPLKAGKNSISIEAFNKTNTVLSVRESMIVDAEIKKRTPKIYAIVFGVNKFQQGNVSELKYSENDAKAIGKVIKNATKYKTYVTYLTGKKATKKNLLEAIDSVKKKAHLEDKIVFYISTHGKAVRGNLYLVPQNNKRVKNWLNFEDIFNKIQSIPALDQIFIIDACESGKASDIMSSVYDAKASVLAKQSGVHVLMATTKGTFAFENPDPSIKHGVFTNNILNILKSKKTDKNSDGWISIEELSDKLKEPEYSVEHQFPIIRNVGQDTNIKRVK